MTKNKYVCILNIFKIICEHAIYIVGGYKVFLYFVIIVLYMIHVLWFVGATAAILSVQQHLKTNCNILKKVTYFCLLIQHILFSVYLS